MEIEVVSGTRNILSPAIVNNYSGLQVPAWWRAMEFLSSNLASFGMGVYRDGVKIDEQHALDRFFNRRANQMQTAYTMWKTWFYHGESHGNGYAYIRRPSIESDEIVGIYTLPHEEVTPYRLVPDGRLFDATVWYWHGPSKQSIPAADMLHYKSQISHDGLVGYNPIWVFERTIRRAMKLEIYQTKFLDNGSMIRGSIEMPAGTTREQAAEIIATAKQYRAATGDRDLIALSGGATLKNTTVSPVDSQLIEQDQEVTKKISQITGVPPQFLMEGAESKYNGSTVEAAGQDVVRFTFRTRIESVEDELTTKLLTQDEQDAGYSIRLDTTALLRGDSAVSMTVAAQGANQGITTPNEARATLNLPADPDPASDKLRTPTHLVANPSQTETESHSKEPSPDQYAVFKPLLEEAANRVETKTGKAMSTADKKTPEERTIYTNVLAETQAKYTAEAFTPLATALKSITGRQLDVAKLSEQYGAEVRRRAAGQTAKALTEYVEEQINVAA